MSAQKIPAPILRFLRKFMRPRLFGPNMDIVEGVQLLQQPLTKHVEERQVEGFEKYFYNEDQILDMSPFQRLITLYEHLEYQVRDLLVHIHDTDNMCKAMHPICSATEKPYSWDYPGFHLRTMQNTKGPEGGTGVFLEGVVEPGTLICFYPGLVFRSWDDWVLNYGTDESHDYFDPMLVRRVDDAVIDGATNIQAWSITEEGRHALGHPYCANTQDFGTFPNPFALAQHVKHPPKSENPNVMGLPFNLEKNVLHDKLLPYVPNQYFPHPEKVQQVQFDHKYTKEDKNQLMKMQVLIATRRIENEEIFMDFRYDPDAMCPDWYHVVDAKKLRLRLNKRGLGGILRGMYRRRQSKRYEIYKEVMKQRRTKKLDDLPENIGFKHSPLDNLDESKFKSGWGFKMDDAERH